VSTFRPMLAAKVELSSLRLPALASDKLDGIRCLAIGGQPLSRSLKVIPNRAVQRFFSDNAQVLEGMDGELIVGPPNATNVYLRTNSAVMSVEGMPDFTYYVFDMHNRPSMRFEERFSILTALHHVHPPRVKLLPHQLVTSLEQLASFEESSLDRGYEGVMLRDPAGLYKQGRSTVREGGLLKLKRHEDAEAVIIGVEEEQQNTNEAFQSELGRTKRSTAQVGMVGKGTLGALVVRGINGPFEGVVFNLGSGFDAAERRTMWQQRAALLHQIVTYKYFAVGVKDRPRFPVFKGLRDKRDMCGEQHDHQA